MVLELKGQNERANRIKQQRQDQLEQSFNDLLDEGKNPYVVFKQRQYDRYH